MKIYYIKRDGDGIIFVLASDRETATKLILEKVKEYAIGYDHPLIRKERIYGLSSSLNYFEEGSDYSNNSIEKIKKWRHADTLEKVLYLDIKELEEGKAFLFKR